MIISASRRTDIPAFHTDWFINRIKSENVYVRNPMNAKQISKVSLKREDVECIVFWTKNPAPLVEKLEALEGYHYYFQYTLNPYDHWIEKGIPDLSARLATFKQLSDRIGKERVIWRYDPILMSDDIDLAYHISHFKSLLYELKDYTERCTISFLDDYPKIRKRLKQNKIRTLVESEIDAIASTFSKLCADCNITLQTCSEEVDLSHYHIQKGKCIDDALIRKRFGYKGQVEKDKNQRLACGCVKSIDIGAYNTCHHECVYCYACDQERLQSPNYNIESKILYGEISDDDKIYNRENETLFTNQLSLFDHEEI